MMKKNNIPLDYRFQPTDEELINHYLLKIVTKQPPACSFAVNYCDIYGGDDKEPWKFFEGKSSSDESDDDDDDEENELYFYTRLKKKTEKSTVRTERTVGCGTWKGRTKGTAIYGKDHLGRKSLIGMRKMFSFTNKGRLTSMNLKEAKRWSYVMHQYSLDGCYKQLQQGDEWVLCRIKRIQRKSSEDSQSFEAAALDTITPTTTVDESTDGLCNYDAPAIDNGASPQPINVDEGTDGLCNFDSPAIDNGAAPQAIIVDEGTDGLGNFDAPAGIVNGAMPLQAIFYESYDEFWNFDAPGIDYEAAPQPIIVDEGPAGFVNGATPPQAIVDESYDDFWNFDAPVIDYGAVPQPINVDELMDELPDFDPAEIYIGLSAQSDSDDLMISWN